MKIIEKFGSQVEFAQACKIEETLLSRVIRGRRSLPTHLQEKWAEGLGCSVVDVFGETNGE